MMMENIRKVMSIALLLLLAPCAMQAQAQQQNEQKTDPAPDFEFKKHWELGAEFGAGYDVGETKFGNLISPTMQVTGAYHFSDYLAARLSVSGFVSKNRYAFPQKEYTWNFVQPALELKANLARLFGNKDPKRAFVPYAFVGLGTSITFNNDDVKKAVDSDPRFFSQEFQKQWTDTRFNMLVRGGVGMEYWFGDRTALTFEANANMLPDHYNSKYGKHDNRDWRFNAMIGLRFSLGDRWQKKDTAKPEVPEPVVTPEPQPEPVVVPEPPFEKPAKITRDITDFTVNIQFEINRSVIRVSEHDKLHELVTYLREHPDVSVLLTGYADRETGTPTINERLSRERALAVRDYLIGRGIYEQRIHTDFKGDRIQPFDFPAQNRVCICIVLNKKYL